VAFFIAFSSACLAFTNKNTTAATAAIAIRYGPKIFNPARASALALAVASARAFCAIVSSSAFFFSIFSAPAFAIAPTAAF